jgi:hypothetical protein
MSKHSGDMARAHRVRKQNIARRMKVRELRIKLSLAAVPPADPAAVQAPAKPPAV